LIGVLMSVRDAVDGWLRLALTLSAGASIDAREFQQRMSRCSLENCRGMCCYDGVPVDDDTAHLLQKLSIERADIAASFLGKQSIMASAPATNGS
jgi:hypothetical protein